LRGLIAPETPKLAIYNVREFRSRPLLHPVLKLMRLVLLILALVSAVHSQKVTYTLVSRSTVLGRLEPAPATLEQRKERLHELFRDAGCHPEAIRGQPVPGLGAGNIMCRLAGTTDQLIIVGASYAPGNPDNWSAAVLLPSIFQALAPHKRDHTILFVAFADEQRKLAGSKLFVTSMSSADIQRIDAMVDLDALGLSPPKVSTKKSDPQLIKDLFIMAYALKLTASQVDVADTFREDADSFAERKVPSITIHSFPLSRASESRGRQLLVPQLFHPDLYYKSYYLISGYVAFLDQRLKARHAP